MSKQTSSATSSKAKSGSTTPKKEVEPAKAEQVLDVDVPSSKGKDGDNKSSAPKLWADPLNPDLPPNWRFLLERGYIQRINFEFTPFGKSVILDIPSIDPAGNAVLLRKSARDGQNYFKDLGVLDKYGRVPKNLLKNPLAGATPSGVVPTSGPKVGGGAPKRSLCESDFEGGLPHLQKRCADVGRDLTVSTFKGRILSLFVPDLGQVQTIEQWWRDAPPSNRMRVLMDGKRFDAFCGRSDLVALAEQLMPNVSVPFRGTLSSQKKGPGEKEPVALVGAEGSNDPSA